MWIYIIVSAGRMTSYQAPIMFKPLLFSLYIRIIQAQGCSNTLSNDIQLSGRLCYGADCYNNTDLLLIKVSLLSLLNPTQIIRQTKHH